MEYLVTAEEMKRYDEYTSKKLGIPEIVLMERAALGCIDKIVHTIKEYSLDKVCILCGYGNNGGDGLAIGRLLYLKGIDTRIIMIGNPDKASESNRIQQNILNNYGCDIVHASFEQGIAYIKGLETSNLIIDALFGIGLNRPLSDEYRQLFECINSNQCRVIAIDVPSGLCESITINDSIIKADITLSFGFLKANTIVFPTAAFCGEVILVEMGIDEHSIVEPYPSYLRIQNVGDCSIPARKIEANKGSYKKLLVIAGSANIYGALYLASKAAFSSGIGMIRILTHENNRLPINDTLPEAMCEFYSDDVDAEIIAQKYEESEKWADGILIGPGIGLGDISKKLVDMAICNSNKPILLDADAITLLAGDARLQEYINPNKSRIVLMTPHVGEFARLAGCDTSDVKRNILTRPKELADRLGVTIVCKDARSIISSYKSDQSIINCSGNEGMASAGSGDVLTGIASVLMLQCEDEFMALASAVYIHGLAGTNASNIYGSRAMVASNIIDELQNIW